MRIIRAQEAVVDNSQPGAYHNGSGSAPTGSQIEPMMRTGFELQPPVSIGDAKQDIDMMLWSIKLCSIRRYFHQRFWEAETLNAEFAEKIEPLPRLESVAEHSWHVADTVMLLAEHFPQLNSDHCAQLAILHDKMEITTGDQNPVGRDGTGRLTHAFNAQKRTSKTAAEREAIESYISRLRPTARQRQADALFELLEGDTQEARFVKAVDKLQALAFVIVKKRGELSDKHLGFTLKYSEKAVTYFAPVSAHYFELRSRLIAQVARRRNCSTSHIEEWFEGQQLQLSFEQEDDE